jgi:methionine biosynthesis protein MetW
MRDWSQIRPDHRAILENVEARASALDLGCGAGDLMQVLSEEKSLKVQGIEIDDIEVRRCVEKGLSVFHGDIDTGLSEFSDKAFDYVILNHTVQQVKHIATVLSEAARVGRTVIVGIPNFAHYKARIQLFFQGKAPVTKALPYKWDETPNIRSLSLKDFKEYCDEQGFKIDKQIFISGRKRIFIFPNVLADTGIFFLSKKEQK